MNKHLAIFSKEAVKQIFKGNKSIETRFSLKKIPPFGVVGRGDLVYIKEAGGEVVGQFIVKKVYFIEGLDKEDWQLIEEKTGEKISLKYQYAQFATIVFITNIEQFLTSPIKFNKRTRSSWVVLKS